MKYQQILLVCFFFSFATRLTWQAPTTQDVPPLLVTSDESATQQSSVEPATQSLEKEPANSPEESSQSSEESSQSAEESLQSTEKSSEKSSEEPSQSSEKSSESPEKSTQSSEEPSQSPEEPQQEPNQSQQSSSSSSEDDDDETATAQSDGTCIQNGKRSNQGSGCHTKKVPYEIKFDGCEPLTVCISVCAGACSSEMRISSDYPDGKVTCGCCKTASYAVPKPRKLMFDCGGKQEERKFFLRNVRSCSCVDCYA